MVICGVIGSMVELTSSLTTLPVFFTTTETATSSHGAMVEEAKLFFFPLLLLSDSVITLKSEYAKVVYDKPCPNG